MAGIHGRDYRTGEAAVRLYKISVSYELVVAAEDDADAVSVGIDNLEQALRDSAEQPDLSVEDITCLDDLPNGWRGCYPYRADRTTPLTVDEMLESPPADPEKQA